MRHLLLALTLTLAPLLAARAQESASLIADAVRLEPGERLIAEGDVEVLYQGTRLSATRITYDRPAGQLDIAGPIRIDDGEGIVTLAEQAALDDDLENGILRSARIVLDRQLQLAANQIARVDDRYTQLSGTVASSCRICEESDTPTWEIRARQVIYDELDQRIYFENATFRALGVPIFYFPRLSLPAPERRRATGLLIPRLSANSELGAGVKIPYFITIGPSADLTLTPYLSPQTATLETDYRQAFDRGTLQFSGALSRDSLREDDERWFLFGEGDFLLPRGARLSFDIETVSDPAYLADYDYSETDRLRSELRLTRARRNTLFDASATRYRTLRDAELPIADELASLSGELTYERRRQLGFAELRYGADLQGVNRAAVTDPGGRDVTSFGATGEMIRRQVLPMGLVARGSAGMQFDIFNTRQDSRFDDTTARLVPTLATELRLPLQRSETTGAQTLIEPVIQLAYSDSIGSEVPNEDSVIVDFDEGNLFALSRFPGDDAVETGFRANTGISYTRIAPSGWSMGVIVGRVFRDAPAGLGAGSGVDGSRSDWLAATRLQLGTRVDLTARAVFDDDLTVRRNETRLIWTQPGFGVEGAYTWLDANPGENRIFDTHELALDTSLRLSRHWTGSLEGRYNFVADQTAEAGIGLQYRTECIVVDLSVERRFIETAAIDPSTRIGLGVSLAGFGGPGPDESYRRSCQG